MSKHTSLEVAGSSPVVWLICKYMLECLKETFVLIDHLGVLTYSFKVGVFPWDFPSIKLGNLFKQPYYWYIEYMYPGLVLAVWLCCRYTWQLENNKQVVPCDLLPR